MCILISRECQGKNRGLGVTSALRGSWQVSRAELAEAAAAPAVLVGGSQLQRDGGGSGEFQEHQEVCCSGKGHSGKQASFTYPKGSEDLLFL